MSEAAFKAYEDVFKEFLGPSVEEQNPKRLRTKPYQKLYDTILTKCCRNQCFKHIHSSTISYCRELIEEEEYKSLKPAAQREKLLSIHQSLLSVHSKKCNAKVSMTNFYNVGSLLCDDVDVCFQMFQKQVF